MKILDSEFSQRVLRLQERMCQEGFDLILCYGNEAEPQYVRYFSDYWPSFETAGVLIPASGQAVLLIGPESYTYAADRSRIADIRQVKAFRESSDPEYPGKKLDELGNVIKQCLAGRTLKRFGVAGLSLMTIGVYHALLDALGSVPVERADSLVNALRMHKSKQELACMRQAAQITSATFDYVLQNVHVGMTENQVVGLALAKMHQLGAERESYPMWVLAGDGSNQAISRPRDKVISKGDLVQIQIGARVAGYASSIGRPVVFGKPTPQQRALIEAGYAGQNAVISALRAGVAARDVAALYTKTITKLGFGSWPLYGPCHGNGLMEGEAPWIESDSDWTLAENMSFCVDIFLGNNEQKMGIRIEDVVRVTQDKAENLTNYPQKLFIID